MADTYAIVESGGKQYRAEKGSVLVVDRLDADEGAKLNLRPVMFRADKDVVLGGGDLEKVKVEAVVARHERGEKVRVFKYRPKKGYRRRAGHRSELTRLEVTDVKMLSRKPAAKKEPAEKKSAAEKKAPAKAGTGKQSTAGRRKTAAKKRASGGAKKSATKKTTTRKSTSTRKTSSQKKES